MGRYRYAVFIIVALLLLALVPYSSAASPGSGSNQERINQQNVSQTKALELLKLLDRLANYTATRISNGTPQEILSLYNQALDLKNRAWGLYENGSYDKAVQVALVSMHLYRDVLSALKPSSVNQTNQTDFELRQRAYVEIGITQQVLDYARSVMEELEMEGVNATGLKETYMETLNVLNAVRDDLKAGNYAALNRDLERLVSLRERLNEEIDVSMKLMVSRESKKLVEKQLRALGILMKHLSRLNTSNSSILEQVEMLESMELQLQQALEENNTQMALELLKSLRVEVEKTVHIMEKGRGREEHRGKKREERTSPSENSTSALTNTTATHETNGQAENQTSTSSSSMSSNQTRSPGGRKDNHR